MFHQQYNHLSNDFSVETVIIHSSYSEEATIHKYMENVLVTLLLRMFSKDSVHTRAF